ncbi:MAG: quinoprotein dehydrogenase-associated SoxYZ-like carrier [Hyphomicrobium sp.]
MPLYTFPATAQAPADPLHSPVWETLVKRTFGDARVVFDDRVKIVVPSIVENQAQVPVTADARAIPNVVQVIVLADLNPIQHVLTLRTGKAQPYISFRMKVEQATPIRVAAMTSGGTWHVGGVYLDATGGGCSASAMARNEADWSDTVGQAQGKVWRDLDGTARVRLRVRHPMDTGLAKDNTPAFYIEKLDVRRANGEPLAGLELFEPVSEDPTVTLLMRVPASDASLLFEGRDNNGTVYKSVLPVPLHQSWMPAATEARQ